MHISIGRENQTLKLLNWSQLPYVGGTATHSKGWRHKGTSRCCCAIQVQKWNRNNIRRAFRAIRRRKKAVRW